MTVTKQTAATLSLLGSGKSAKKKRGEEVPLTVHKAWTDLEKAQLELERFHAENEDVIERYGALRQGVTDATNKFKEQYHLNAKEVGPTFHGFFIQQRRYVDATKLVKLVPDAKDFVKLSIAMPDFDALVRDGIIDEDTAEEVVTVEETVCAPRK